MPGGGNDLAAKLLSPDIHGGRHAALGQVAESREAIVLGALKSIEPLEVLAVERRSTGVPQLYRVRE